MAAPYDFTKHQIMTPPPALTGNLCEGSNKLSPISDKPTKRPLCPDCGNDVGILVGQMTNHFKAHVAPSMPNQA